MMIKKLLSLVSLITVFSLSGLSQEQSLLLKVGYVDTEYVFSKIPESKQIEEKLKVTETNLKNEFAEKQQQFQKQYADYSSNITTMADTVRSKSERHLGELNRELQQFEQTAQITLENTRKLHMAPVYLKIANAINQVALENGYGAILQHKVSGYEILLYADKKNDLSELVIKKLLPLPTPTTK